MDEADQPERKAQGRCPLCDRPRDARFRPFCSARCRDQDLLRWLDGRYAIPAVDAEDEEAERER